MKYTSDDYNKILKNYKPLAELFWTVKRPTEAGWYGVFGGKSAWTQYVRVDEGLRVWLVGYEKPMNVDDFAQWFGPIPELQAP